MSERTKYVKATKSALLFIGIATACVLVLFAIGSAQMSNPNNHLKVTNTSIFADDGEYHAYAEVTTIKEIDRMGVTRERSGNSTRSYWVPVGVYDTREDAEQELDKFKERIESGDSPW